jgi:hypothetical protein
MILGTIIVLMTGGMALLLVGVFGMAGIQSRVEEEAERRAERARRKAA